MSMDNVLIQRTPYMLYAGRVQIEFTSSLCSSHPDVSLSGSTNLPGAHLLRRNQSSAINFCQYDYYSEKRRFYSDRVETLSTENSIYTNI